jgi:N-terminal half of MaoC dehydratase
VSPTSESLISAEMHEIVGRELDRQVSFPIAESDIRRWALATYYPELPPRRFWDREAAAASRHGGIVAPEEMNPFAWFVADPLGPPLVLGSPEDMLGVPEPDLPAKLRAGMRVTYGVPMRVGDVITSVRRLFGYDEHDGRLGPMLFTTTEEEWTNQANEVVKRYQNTFIRYRPRA